MHGASLPVSLRAPRKGAALVGSTARLDRGTMRAPLPRVRGETARNAMNGHSHLILYVADQARSRAFYGAVLGAAARLDVPGMTEFELPGGAVLGLMPESAIERLLGRALPRPSLARGVPRAELYLLVDDPAAFHARALAAGATELSPLGRRSWGHAAAYALDPDAHVLAFAVEAADRED